MFKRVVVALVVLSAMVTASLEEASENPRKAVEPTKEDLEKMLNYLLHPRSHGHRKLKRHCGVSALRKLETLCPDFCTVPGNTILHSMCTTRMTDEDIRTGCCPELE
ncbi:Protein CBG07124 [Caenorhabditis briggsae]|uniref:Protein CBG07124 n=1 Tax=Caenorhabditis briggsae TaxID=6238 RepID=A8X3N1_CAEBR|nr:Protein CBG07124 [Caenorhabditis briggsae]CAP27241.1 Protein CBG07124 [Caenorhabditis briggsae]